MAVVAILISDTDEGVDVDVRGDSPMDDAENFTPAQSLATLMIHSGMQAGTTEKSSVILPAGAEE
jgi:hypothetical protein